MKNSFKILSALVAALALLGLPVRGQVYQGNPTPGQTAWSGGSTNMGSALSTIIAPASSANGGTPTVTCVSAGSDVAGAKIQFYKIDAVAVENYTNSTTSLPVTSTNGFGASDVIIVRHLANDWYEKRTTTTFTSGTNLTVTVAPLQAVLPGDIIYHCTTTGAPLLLLNSGAGSVAAMTNTIAGASLVTGQRGLPLMGEINGTSAACFYAMTVNWTYP